MLGFLADVAGAHILFNVSGHTGPVKDGCDPIIGLVVSGVSGFCLEVVFFLQNGELEVLGYAYTIIASAVVEYD